MLRVLSDRDLEMLTKTGSFSFEGDSVEHYQLLDNYVTSPKLCWFKLRIKLSKKGTAKLCRYLGILNTAYDLNKALRLHVSPEQYLMQNRYALKSLVYRKHTMIRVDYEKEVLKYLNTPAFGLHIPNMTKTVTRSCMVPFAKEDFTFTCVNAM